MPVLGITIPNMGIQKIQPPKRRAASKPATPSREIVSARAKAPKKQTVTTGLADALFGRTKQRVLALLFGQPDRSFVITELIAMTGAGSGAVQREIARLASSGLVTTRKLGNQKHYQSNAESPIHEELIGVMLKTSGLAEPLRAALAPLADQIAAAFVYGSVAKRRDTAASDIDLMIVSESLGYGEVFGALEEVANKLGRTVNPTVYTAAEFSRRLKDGNAFLSRVYAQPKLWLIGGDLDLTA